MSQDVSDNLNPGNPKRFFVKTFQAGPLGCNCTILGDTETGQGIVVDPGGDIDTIMAILQQAGLHTVVQILHTHAHFDHFLASGDLHEKTGAPLCVHEDDKPLWMLLEQQCARFAIPYQPVPDPHHYLSHQEALGAGGLNGEALWTPGHSPGSMSFWFPSLKLLLAGDTLFRRGVGRTDLWGGDIAQLANSIRRQLYVLDDDAKVIPGHGASTTIGEEMRSNPFVAAS